MHPIIRNILAVILGIVIGSLVNYFIIMIGGNIIPPPTGADVNSSEGLRTSIHLFEIKHFIFPFLAHALGTFFGAFAAYMIAADTKFKFAITIGIFFLLGGISMVVMVSSPIWFTILDLVVAYLPMAYLATIVRTRH